MSTEMTPPPSPLSAPRNRRRWVWLALLVVVGVGAGLGLRPHFLEVPAPQPPAELEAPSAPAVPAEAPPILDPTLPALDASDELARAWAQKLSSSPAWLGQLSMDGVIRRAVAWVAAIADGERPMMTGLPWSGPFEIVEEGDLTFISDASYARYDHLAQAVSSLDARGAGEALERLLPLFEQAWREVAPPSTRFRQGLGGAVHHLLAAPDVEGPVEVQPSGGILVFADPELEKLSPAQKQLLRMGPANSLKVKAKLRELAESLNLPPPSK